MLRAKTRGQDVAGFKRAEERNLAQLLVTEDASPAHGTRDLSRDR
jgi:hypothetical protein